MNKNQEEIKYAESLAESILGMEIKNFKFDNEII